MGLAHETIQPLDTPGHALALSADGGLLAIAGVTNGITVWAAATGKLLHNWPTQNPVGSLPKPAPTPATPTGGPVVSAPSAGASKVGVTGGSSAG